MKEKRYNICFAILLLILGIAILGEAFKLYNLSDLFAGWWSIFIILWGVLGVGFKKSKYSYIFIIGFGIALLLSKQRVITNNQMLLLLFSLFVILLGISILCLIFNKKVKNVVNSEINSFYSAFLGSISEKFGNSKLESKDIWCFLGNADLDFSNTKLTEDINVNINCILGEVDIILPKNVGVKINNRTILGSTESSRNKTTKQSHFINITGICILGSIDIK